MGKRVFECDGIWKAENEKTSIVFEVIGDRPPKRNWTDVGRPLGLERKEQIRRISKCLVRYEEDGVAVLKSLLLERKFSKTLEKE